MRRFLRTRSAYFLVGDGGTIEKSLLAHTITKYTTQNTHTDQFLSCPCIRKDGKTLNDMQQFTPLYTLPLVHPANLILTFSDYSASLNTICTDLIFLASAGQCWDQTIQPSTARSRFNRDVPSLYLARSFSFGVSTAAVCSIALKEDDIGSAQKMLIKYQRLARANSLEAQIEIRFCPRSGSWAAVQRHGVVRKEANMGRHRWHTGIGRPCSVFRLRSNRQSP